MFLQSVKRRQGIVFDDGLCRSGTWGDAWSEAQGRRMKEWQHLPACDGQPDIEMREPGFLLSQISGPQW